MAAPPNKTMFSYFTKLPSKTSIEEENPRKSAPIFNKQHVEVFKTKVDQFDLELINDCTEINYISSIKSKEHKPYSHDRKFRGSLRARLLQFHEDVRPPYFGTWQKESKLVTGRRPYGQDNEILDYENDSEAEWDLGGPGESLKGDDSEDEEGVDDYEIDMKTFVPHGYVSDDEIDKNSDNEDSSNPTDQTSKPTPDNGKLKLLGLIFGQGPTSFLHEFQGVKT